MPSNKDAKDESEVHLSQVMVDQTGLTILKVPTEEVVEKIPFELVQGWWLDSVEEMTVIVTDDTRIVEPVNGKEDSKSEKGTQSAKHVTREIKIKSKRAQDIVDCMQDVVTNILQVKHENQKSLDSDASGSQENGSSKGESTLNSGTKSKAGESQRKGYVYLKSGFLVSAYLYITPQDMATFHSM